MQSDLDVAAASELAAVVKALADPTRLRIVDALRKSAPQPVTQTELMPLFDMTQQALSRHLKVLVEAGVVAAERRGLWAYYVVAPDALRRLRDWLT